MVTTPDAQKKKDKLSICFIGHVDSGKSTTVGRLAFEFGALTGRHYEKLLKEADAKGKNSFSYAFFTDRNEAERDRGITITTTLVKLETNKFTLNVIDCPGHKDFIKNMVSGTAQADVAVVIVPSAISEFESALESGTLKDHIMISGVLGIRKIIIAINKVDVLTDDIRQSRYENVADEMVRVVKKIHPDKNPIVIPISGLKGINMSNKGERFEWFKGWKETPTSEPIFTLEQAIDYQSPAKREVDKPLRAVINQVMKVPGVGSVLTAQVLQGRATPGLAIYVNPGEFAGEIKTLEIHKQSVPEVVAGDNFGFVMKVLKGDIKYVKAGYVMSSQKDNPVRMYKGARGKVICIDHPKGIRQGYTPVLDLGVIHVPVKIAKLESKVSRGVPSTNPEIVLKGDVSVSILVPQKECVMDTAKNVPQLAKFALRDGGKVVGIGSIEAVFGSGELGEIIGEEKPEKGAGGSNAGKEGDKKKKK